MENATRQLGDSEAIRKTIQTYIDGGISGKGDDMRPAFHDGATIYGYIGEDLFGGPIDGLFEWIDGNGPADELKPNIANIDIEGTIATVRVELDNWTGHKFTDMFTLLKTDGEWKIISKVFFLHPEIPS
ncbi:MAG: nuclear transport factor 2 family protein [Pyrinomonadaceae bacterium]